MPYSSHCLSLCGRLPDGATAATPSTASPTAPTSACNASDRPTARRAWLLSTCLPSTKASSLGGQRRPDKPSPTPGHSSLVVGHPSRPQSHPADATWLPLYTTQSTPLPCFSGAAGGGQFYADTWSWNGSVWTELAATGPSLFGGPVAGFDPISQKPLLVGMASGGVSQTWTWDGAKWLELTPAHAPSGRQSRGGGWIQARAESNPTRPKSRYLLTDPASGLDPRKESNDPSLSRAPSRSPSRYTRKHGHL